MKRDDAFNVTKLDLINPRTNDGYNVNATIVFNTPAAISVEMVSCDSTPTSKLLTDETFLFTDWIYAKPWSTKGAVSFNLTIDDSNLGYIDIPDLTLRNGTSTAIVLGDLDIKLLIRKGLWESSNSNYGKVTIGIHGNRSVYNGEEIPYFTAAVKAISASTTINLFDYVSDILGGW